MANSSTLFVVLFFALLFTSVMAGSREETTDAAAAAPDATAETVHKRSLFGGGGWGNQNLCQNLFDSRNQLLQQLVTGAAAQLAQWEYVALKASLQLLDQALQGAQCCSNSQALAYFTSNYAPAKGPVCGMDFNTYTTPAAACAVGVYHANACFSHNTNEGCYAITNLANRTLCIGGLSQTIAEIIQLPAQPIDLFLLQQVPPCVGSTYDNTQFRTADGSCNNVGSVPAPGTTPAMNVNFRYSGMAGNKFLHEWSGYAQLNASLNNYNYISNGPNPRDISNRLFTQTTFQPNPVNANGLAMAWINFFVHDFMNHQNDDWQNYIAVELPEDDPLWNNYDENYPNDLYMLIPSTYPSNDWNGQGFPTRRNLNTAWFDLSQVYGSDPTTQYVLRAFQGGLLNMNPTTNNLPDDTIGYITGSRLIKNPFLAGDFRVNFHPGLTAMHTIWAREHNNVAHLLALNYPTMTDEQLFQTARLIVGREMVQVHEAEWSNQMYTDLADQTVTLGLLQMLTPNTPVNPFATTAVPEEFVAMYKWHTFVNPYLTLRTNTGTIIKGASNIDYIAQFQDTTLIRTYGISAVAVGLATEPCGIQRFGNLPPGLQNIQHPFLVSQSFNLLNSYPACEVVPVFDSITTDIVRDRERGIPKYNTMRQLVGAGNLPLATYFDDLGDNSQQAATLADLYQWNLNNVDAIVGAHGEHLYPNQGFPLTMVAAFIPFVIARVTQDRFYTTDFTAAKFTQWGLNRIATIDFAQVLCDTGVTCNIPNRAAVFQVWNTAQMGTQTIHPTTH